MSPALHAIVSSEFCIATTAKPATRLAATGGVELLSLYGRYVSDHPSAYGTLGGVLIVMLWMNVVSQMLFFGAEICKAVFWSRTDDPLRCSELTDTT